MVTCGSIFIIRIACKDKKGQASGKDNKEKRVFRAVTGNKSESYFPFGHIFIFSQGATRTDEKASYCRQITSRKRSDCGACFGENTREKFFVLVPKIFTSRSKRKVFPHHVFRNRILAFSRTRKEKRCLCVIGNFGHVADASSSRPKMPTFGAVVKT
ncbi:hypothetical protein HMPREF1554_00495 [Porphyromonas gingivalis F0569]|nr:hypothetical protein HMPREF1554_00495 [Porphyromonas gingivalis F0569]